MRVFFLVLLAAIMTLAFNLKPTYIATGDLGTFWPYVNSVASLSSNIEHRFSGCKCEELREKITLTLEQIEPIGASAASLRTRLGEPNVIRNPEWDTRLDELWEYETPAPISYGMKNNRCVNYHLGWICHH